MFFQIGSRSISLLTSFRLTDKPLATLLRFRLDKLEKLSRSQLARLAHLVLRLN